jgi:hypothetical protein
MGSLNIPIRQDVETTFAIEFIKEIDIPMKFGISLFNEGFYISKVDYNKRIITWRKNEL